MLGKKQALTNDDWVRAFESVHTVVTPDHIEQLATAAVKEIRRCSYGLNASYAWSGGKDSLVLSALCERAGVRRCMISLSNLEYPVFVRWIEKNRPEGLEIVNTGQDLRWLSEHQDMLFPPSSKVAGKWFPLIQWAGQERYYFKNDIDLMIMGRRKIEGNFVGRNGTHCYTKGNGMTILNPIADWKHEDILGFIRYHGLQLPPIYYFHNGFRRGTHPWPARKWTNGIMGGWAEVHTIDPGIVEAAAEYIPTAAKYLEGLKS